MSKKTYLDLTNELKNYPPLRQLDALQDGDFLSSFAVSQDQIEELYRDALENLPSTIKYN
jgi:hypothetical protein